MLLFAAGPLATVSTTLVAVYEMLKCSVPPLIAIVEFVNVPLTLDAVRMVNTCPAVGVNLFTKAAVSVPPRLAAPEICSWLNCVPSFVPPIETFIVPVDNCV